MVLYKIILSALLLTLLAACQPDTSNGSTAQTDPESATIVELSEQFADNGLTFNYPNGWVTKGNDGEAAIIANRQPVLDAMDTSNDLFIPDAGDLGIFLFVVPPILASPGSTPGQVLDLFTEFPQSDGLVLGDISEITLDGKLAARLTAKNDRGQGEVIAVDAGDEIVVLLALAPQSGYKRYVSTIEQIAASVSIITR